MSMTSLSVAYAPQLGLVVPRTAMLCLAALVLLMIIGGPIALAQQPAATEAPAYRIGIGDTLQVFVPAENTTAQCLVRPDGMISLAQIGEVQAAGKTPLELKTAIEAGLSKFFENPLATVAVEEINSYRIYMLGNVGAQQEVISVTPLRLLQALSIAGGLNEFANDKLIVMRDEGGTQRRIEVDLSKILKGKGDLSENIWLYSGDIVVAQ